MDGKPSGLLYRLTIKSRRSAVPEIIRLRRVLKALLRHYDFECVAHEELREQPRAKQSA